MTRDPLAQAAKSVLDAIMAGDHREKSRQLDRLRRMLSALVSPNAGAVH